MTTEPSRPSLPDTPWTTVEVTFGDATYPHPVPIETHDLPNVWFWRGSADKVLATDLACVTSVTVLAEPPATAEMFSDDALMRVLRSRFGDRVVDPRRKPARSSRAETELAPPISLHFNEQSITRLIEVLRGQSLDLMADHVEEQRAKMPAEQGDTGSDEAKVYSWVEKVFNSAEAGELEDSAVRRALESAAGGIGAAERSAVSRSAAYTDRKIAEAVSQIVAAIESQTTKGSANFTEITVRTELARVARALADGENGGADA